MHQYTSQTSDFFSPFRLYTIPSTKHCVLCINSLFMSGPGRSHSGEGENAMNVKKAMQLELLVRGSHECTGIVFIFLAIMGLTALIGGCILISEGDFALEYLTHEDRCFFTAVALLILGILFLVWSAILTGCSICLAQVHKDELKTPKSEWSAFVNRSRICTTVACILLAVTGFAMLITAIVLVTGNPLPFPDIYYQAPCYHKGLMDYAGGFLLILLAVIFFIWSAIMVTVACYLKRARKSELN